MVSVLNPSPPPSSLGGGPDRSELTGIRPGGASRASIPEGDLATPLNPAWSTFIADAKIWTNGIASGSRPRSRSSNPGGSCASASVSGDAPITASVPG
jgi:hypothetical protein